MKEKEGCWCVYKDQIFARGVGKITKESKKTVHIRVLEKQLYPSMSWPKRYILRFETITGAIKKLFRLRGQSLREIKKEVAIKFPSQKKEISKIKV